MSDWKNKLKETAFKVGLTAQKDPRLMKAAENVKETIDAFRRGYREQMEPEKHGLVCPHCGHTLTMNAKYCSECGAKVDHDA
jgi:rubrerythrin